MKSEDSGFVKRLTNSTPEASTLETLIYGWLIFGLVILYSASLPEGVKLYQQPLHFVGLQLVWVVIGLACFQIIIRLPLSFWWRWSPLFFIGVFVAVLLARFTGVSLNGAARWIALGPFNIQPSEFAKPMLVLQTTWVLNRWPRLPSWARTGWCLALLGLVGAVLAQPSLSMASLMLCVLGLMIFMSGFPLPWLGGLLLVGAPFLTLKVATTNYQTSRLTAFVDPFAHAQGSGFQVVQSILAIASGGLWGVGFGMSSQKVGTLPYPYSDFIFAVFAEEFGLVGVLAFLSFLVVFTWTGLQLSLRPSTPRPIGLLALGTTLMLVIQSLLHLAVVTSSVPPTGMPLPLVSYGGSGLVAALVTAGLLVRCARESGQARLEILAGGKP